MSDTLNMLQSVVSDNSQLLSFEKEINSANLTKDSRYKKIRHLVFKLIVLNVFNSVAFR